MKLTTLLAGLFLTAAAVAQTGPHCTFTNFGRPCGGSLNGSLHTAHQGSAIVMDVTHATPDSIAILAAGHQANRPHPLPGSDCLLLVQPRLTLWSQVDPRGNATFHLRLPHVSPLDVDFQVVTLALHRNGLVARSTNGVNMQCR